MDAAEFLDFVEDTFTTTRQANGNRVDIIRDVAAGTNIARTQDTVMHLLVISGWLREYAEQIATELVTP